jgi:short-subunit dehydrogenase involved in D-alanine esterification of teichoic acids
MEPLGVVITIDRVYTELRAVHDEVRDMRGEVKDIADHEHRLRLLERKVWIAAGVSAGLAGGLVQVINSLMLR